MARTSKRVHRLHARSDPTRGELSRPLKSASKRAGEIVHDRQRRREEKKEQLSKRVLDLHGQLERANAELNEFLDDDVAQLEEHDEAASTEEADADPIQMPSKLFRPLRSQTLMNIADIQAAAHEDLSKEGNREELRKLLRECCLVQVRACALSAAQETGQLLTLLKHFEMPLFLFTQMATSHEQDAKIVFKEAVRDYIDSRPKMSFPTEATSPAGESNQEWPADPTPKAVLPVGGLSRWRPADPTPEAMLLANFVKVPCASAEMMMEGIVEDMAVYQDAGEEEKQWDSCMFRFPDALRPFFLEMKVTDMSDLQYDPKGRTCTHPNIPKCNTSKEHRITLSGTYRVSVLIPFRAKKFVYLYSTRPSKMTGGFLYLDGYGQPLRVNEMGTACRKHALAFGEKHTLRKEDGDRLRDVRKPTSIRPLKKIGATHYAWFGPGDTIDEREVKIGGFAYYFKNDDKNCYFEICSVSQLVEYSIPRWSRQLTVSKLPWNATALHIEQNVTRTKDQNGHWIQSWISGGIVAASVARFMVSDVLHPVVLKSLCTTSQVQVRETLAAEAIAQAALDGARRGLHLKIFMEMVNIVGIYCMSQRIRSNLETAGGFFWFMYSAMWLVWLATTVVEVCTFKAYRHWRERYSWTMLEYFHLRLFSFFDLFVMLALLCKYLGFSCSDLEEASHAVLRPLLACATGLKWYILLRIISNFEIARLGKRILPFIEALKEAFDFFVITMFFTVAFVQAWFALAGDSLMVIFQKIYILMITQEFEEDAEQNKFLVNTWHRGQDQNQTFSQWQEGDGPDAWYHLQFVLFALTSFVLTLTLANMFVGIMTNAFDRCQGRETELFVQKRLRTGLFHILFLQGLKLLTSCFCSAKVVRRLDSWLPTETERDEFLWFCYPKSSTDDPWSIYRQLNEQHHQQNLQRQRQDASNESLDTLTEEMGEISHQLTEQHSIQKAGALRLHSLTGKMEGGCQGNASQKEKAPARCLIPAPEATQQASASRQRSADQVVQGA